MLAAALKTLRIIHRFELGSPIDPAQISQRLWLGQLGFMRKFKITQ
jgi:hypothetical protein